MNVVFLDYDGVVNIPLWYYDDSNKLLCTYNYPEDGKVNSWQAVQWVSEFCERFDYSIVISSSWRSDSNYQDCLRNGGLRKNIEIIGRTPIFHKERGDEITAYLKNHPEVTGYLIFDDDSDMTTHMDKLVKCDGVVGFTLREYQQAVMLHQAFNQ